MQSTKQPCKSSLRQAHPLQLGGDAGHRPCVVHLHQAAPAAAGPQIQAQLLAGLPHQRRNQRAVAPAVSRVQHLRRCQYVCLDLIQAKLMGVLSTPQTAAPAAAQDATAGSSDPLLSCPSNGVHQFPSRVSARQRSPSAGIPARGANRTHLSGSPSTAGSTGPPGAWIPEREGPFSVRRVTNLSSLCR